MGSSTAMFLLDCRPIKDCVRIIAMMSPEDSWVSKWQRVSNFKPGVYAVSVTGRLPQGIVRELKSRGVAYKSRDTAIKT
ncbi:transcription elongation factor SPT4 isoform X6 [Rattus norvegicus]|uniref:transcription elongation factor SPT4 isoform X6 n=1 Tax=Rattus norvegicus TaxID=10116 RepID=UPI001917715E|nr:transcription elongation factor SPT4 isoform X4 [Rattus norvegicus]